MSYQETLPRIRVSRRDMMKRVARFSRLKGFDGGLPDSKMPGCERTLYNVIGFQPPAVEQEGKQSPVGEQAARMAAIKISEGFNLGYCKALPGKGADAAQPRHERDLHRDHGHLARELGERAGEDRARRPRAPRRDLVPRGRVAPLHERHQGPEEQAIDPDVHHRRRRAERRVHERVDGRARARGRLASEDEVAVDVGVFDHLDLGAQSPERYYRERLEIVAAYDRAGFRSYHVAEHHLTPLGMAASPSVFLAAVA